MADRSLRQKWVRFLLALAFSIAFIVLTTTVTFFRDLFLIALGGIGILFTCWLLWGVVNPDGTD